MKRLLTLCLLSFLAQLTYAQVDGTYKNSIAIRGYSMVKLPKILDQSNSGNYVNTALNGVMLKFHDNQINFRLSGSYFSKNIDFSDTQKTVGKVSDYSLKLGFEKNFNYSTIQPYFFMDMGYRSNTFSGMVRNNLIVDANKDGFTLAPGFGIKINMLKELTFFAEGNAEFFYFMSKDESLNQTSNISDVSKYWKSQFLINPISIGLQFQFGSND
ncbi:hypothetical protein [Pedobacter duraquae]|uniref:Outer membrane protein with beta-barrel domain n=1 Tax=Pedobacter duraquae TaxID=425511 RepID=A0A4R6IQ08_9SPHI|nr:hypothetical protein [Pedobacter duraquae]TDO24400.1 hypothetical protein CLV32_0689 [Pedobacter duraquae]